MRRVLPVPDSEWIEFCDGDLSLCGIIGETGVCGNDAPLLDEGFFFCFPECLSYHFDLVIIALVITLI